MAATVTPTRVALGADADASSMTGMQLALPAVLLEAPNADPEWAGWLGSLRTLVAECAAKWDLEIGYAAVGTPTALRVRCRRRGRPVTLKVFPGADACKREAAVLRAARGRGYSLLFEVDAERHALLLESLGPPLAAVDDRVITGTLVNAWSVPLTAAPEVDESTHPAAVLRAAIHAHPPTPGVPDCGRAIDRALAFAEHRIADNDPARHVVVHGEPRPDLLLSVHSPRPGAETGYVLIEPQGFRCEREYDLGVLLRESSRALLGADDPVVEARGRCAHLAEATGTDADIIWQWAAIQRVARGLTLLHGDAPLTGRLYLQAAMAMVNRWRG